MSKSKGNVLDPIDLIDGIDIDNLVEKRTYGLLQPALKEKIEQATRKQFPKGIPAHGTDALRLTFCSLASTGRDVRFDLGRLDGYRNFCNKLWNASRFVLMNLPQDIHLSSMPIDITNLHPINQWILLQLNNTFLRVHDYFQSYRFDLLIQTLYEFTWYEFCDWYLELAKTLLNDADLAPQHKGSTQQTLLTVLDRLLRLLHPFAPFITEKLWQQVAPLLGHHSLETIMLQPYPQHHESWSTSHVEKEMKWMKKIVLAIRNMRSEMNIAPGKPVQLSIRFAGKKELSYLTAFQPFIQNLTKVQTIRTIGKNESVHQAISAVVGKTELFISMEGLIDKPAELARLQKELDRVTKDLERSQLKLQNENFVKNAPKAIVNQEKKRVEEMTIHQQKLVNQLEKIRALR